MNKHILVTEDDKNVADGLREILESDGYTVSCADCASAAMQTMRDGGADLVILDVRLGQDDGYELCRRIREFSNVPILFLTACSSEIELVRGFVPAGTIMLQSRSGCMNFLSALKLCCAAHQKRAAES